MRLPFIPPAHMNREIHTCIIDQVQRGALMKLQRTRECRRFCLLRCRWPSQEDCTNPDHKTRDRNPPESAHN